MAHNVEKEIDGVIRTVTEMDHTAQEIDDAVDDVEHLKQWHSNPNLLDNWYFADPFDQQGGYVVPPDTPYYSDTALTTLVGAVATYTTVTYVGGMYGAVTVSGTTYYVDWTLAVRGYSGNKYTIERWRTVTSNTVHLITSNGIRVCGNADNTLHSLQTTIENPKQYVGKTVTLSFFVPVNETSDGLTASIWYGAGSVNQTAHSGVTVTVPAGQTGLITCTGVLSDMGDYASANPSIRMLRGTGYFEVSAAKLELGDKQTLARQDENGNWVLIDPPPNKALELAKCQRYLLNVTLLGESSASVRLGVGIAKSATEVDVFVPVPVTMRARPTVTAKDLYFNDGTKMLAATFKANDHSNNGLRLVFTVENGTPGASGILHTGARGGLLLFDANL